MVFYLGIDYLSNAIEARKKLLAKCLITVPKYLEKLDSYSKDGEDGTYKTPWTKAKPDEQFLFGESVTVKEDGTKLTSLADSVQPEVYNSGKDEDISIEDRVTFDLDCDIVPSSNPSSEEETLFANGIEEDCTNLLQENFRKESLDQTDEWKLETLICKKLDEDEYIGEAKDAFSLKALQVKLQAETVPDPLVQAVKLPPVDSYISKDETLKSCTKTLQVDHEAGILHETFKEEMAVVEEEIEEVVLTDDFPDNVDVQAEMASLLLSAALSKTTMLVKEDVSLQKEIETAFHPDSELTSKLEAPAISSVNGSKITFVEINDTGNEEVDKFCDSAWLDSPLASSPDPSMDWRIDNLKCEPFDLSQSTPRLLSEEQQKMLTEQCLSSEYFLDEIQADRLPEPHMADMDITRVIGTGVQDLVQVYRVAVDRGIGSLELDLPWQLLKYMDPAFSSWRTLASLSTDQSMDELGNRCNIEPVEIFHKNTMTEMQEFQANSSERFAKANELDQNNMAMTSAVTSTSTEDANTAKPPKIHVRPRTTGYSLDPVGDFMALRSKPVQDQQANKSNESFAVLEKSSTQAITEVPPPIPKKDSKRGSKHHVATVKLSDEFQCLVDYMEETATPYIEQLRRSGELSPNTVFCSLTPDSTKFRVQQREKYIRDERIEASSDEVYKSAVCLYALCQAVEYLQHCCLEAAIGFLSAVMEEYHVIRKSVLGSVLKRLVDKQAELSRCQTHHPKVAKLCREIETWLRKKRAKSGDTEQKILVLVKNEMPSSLNCLKNALSNGNLLVSEILASQKSEDIIQSLDTHNCLIACPRFVQAEFPWAQFCLVVEYEYQQGSDWQLTCQRQNIRHIGIQLQLEQALAEKTMSNDGNTKFADKQISLIGSLETITSNTELLQLLESKHNMLLLERDYSIMASQGDVVFSDLDIDASSCIVVASLADLQDDCSVLGVVRTLVALSIKYTRCFCLLSSVRKENGYELPGHIITNLSHLKAATANLTAKLPDYTVKFVHCGEASDLALEIRCISELCLSEVPADRRQTWLDRAWLAQEVSQEEKFLMMTPCLSSYSIQLMLQTMDLKSLITSSQEELHKLFPEIPAKIIEAFYCHMNTSRGLHLQSDSNCDEEVMGSVEEFTASISPAVSVQDKANPEGQAQGRVYPCVDYPDLDAIEMTSKRVSREEADRAHDNFEPDRVIPSNQRPSNQCSVQAIGDNQLKGQAVDIGLTYKPQQTKLEKLRADERSHQTAWNKLDKFVADRTKVPIDINKGYNSINLANGGVDGKTLEFTGPKVIEPTPHAGNNYNKDIDRPYARDNASRFDAAAQCQYENERHYLQRQQAEGRPMPTVSNTWLDRKENVYPPCNSQDGTDFPSDVYTGRLARDDNERTSRRFQEPNDQFTADRIRSIPVQTFDYNHGLTHYNTTTHASIPYARETTDFNQNERNAEEEFMLEFQKHQPLFTEVDFEQDFPSLESFRTRLPTYIPLQEQHTEVDTSNLNYRPYQESMADIARHFPSSKDIDSQERLPKSSKYPSITNHLVNTQTYDPPMPNHFTNFNDTHGEAPSCSANIPQDPGYGMHPDWQNTFPSSSMNEEVQFQPSLNYTDNLKENCADVEHGNSKELPSKQPKTGGGQEVVSSYFKDGPNSCSALKKQLQHANRINPRKDFATSLKDDLRETTRRLLENSQQFSKLDSHFVRRPLQAMNIGLAQPLPRKNKEGMQEKTARQERQLMEQSMWASDSSPPMDLVEDSIPVDSQYAHCSDGSNRAVFTYLTPSKKRKLTYERVPGRRGQTKLVFY